MYDSAGKADKVATTLIQDAKKGIGTKDDWDGDEKTVANFLDYLDEQSKNFDWERIRMVTTANSTPLDLILEHGLISLKELQDHINAAYWNGI